MLRFQPLKFLFLIEVFEHISFSSLDRFHDATHGLHGLIHVFYVRRAFGLNRINIDMVFPPLSRAFILIFPEDALQSLLIIHWGCYFFSIRSKF